MKNIGEDDQLFIHSILKQMNPKMKHIGESTHINVNVETKYYTVASKLPDKSCLLEDVNFDNELWYLKVILIGYKYVNELIPSPMWRILLMSNISET